jgi:hypothetical protein
MPLMTWRALSISPCKLAKQEEVDLLVVGSRGWAVQVDPIFTPG